MEDHTLIQDLLNRASLNLSDSDVIDNLVQQLLRHQLSPKLNSMYSELIHFQSEKIPTMDPYFIQSFLDAGHKAIIGLELQYTLSWIKTKQYGHTWIRLSKSLKSYPLKYVFVLRKDHYSIFTINIYAGNVEKDTLHVLISNSDPLYPDDDTDHLHNTEFTITTERLFESLPIIFKNLEKATKTGLLNFNLLDPEGRSDDEINNEEDDDDDDEQCYNINYRERFGSD
jgi:hypothetical protein